MRILIAVHTYYPDKNGVQAVTQYIAEGLARRHEVLIITELKETYKRAEIKNGVSIERIKVNKRRYHFDGEKKKFLERIHSYAPDVLISVCTQSWPFDWVKKKVEKLNCKKVLYTHGYSGLMKKYPIVNDLINLRLRAFEYHLHWMLYYCRAYKYIRKYDLVTYLSKNNLSSWYAKRHGLTNGAILSNAVEDEFFLNPSSDRIAGGNINNKVRYIYVANYDNNKNQKGVLEAFLEAGLDEAELVFIGSKANGYYEELLEKNEQKNGQRKNISFLIGLERKEIAEQLTLADVFVCGSKKEEYPLMLCEAAAKGLPIISTNVGHVSEMQGCIVVKDMSDMARQIRRLYEEPQERWERGKMLRQYALNNYQIKDKVEWLEHRLMEL